MRSVINNFQTFCSRAWNYKRKKEEISTGEEGEGGRGMVPWKILKVETKICEI